MATRRSIQTKAFNAVTEGLASVVRNSTGDTIALTAGRRAVDEQASLGNDLLAGVKVALDLDEVAVDQAGLDLAEFDRLVLVRHPDPDLIAFIDQSLLRHTHGEVIA